MSDTCIYPLCKSHVERSEFCLGHAKYFAPPKPAKKRSGINKVADKRKLVNKEYRQIVNEVLKITPYCAIKEEGCTGKAEGLHHQKKRTPATMLDKRYLIPACNSCQLWVEIHPLEATEKGYSLSKYKKEPLCDGNKKQFTVKESSGP